MKAKIKKSETKVCQLPGCRDKAVCGWQPKNRMDKMLWVCRRHRDEADLLWKLAGVRKPDKILKPKLVVKNRKPKREGKPKWQEVLDQWFAKGKYPVGKFMNLKRWEYWISIGGEKPEGDSRKFDQPVKAVIAETPKKLKAKVRRKKSY